MNFSSGCKQNIETSFGLNKREKVFGMLILSLHGSYSEIAINFISIKQEEDKKKEGKNARRWTHRMLLCVSVQLKLDPIFCFCIFNESDSNLERLNKRTYFSPFAICAILSQHSLA